MRGTLVVIVVLLAAAAGWFFSSWDRASLRYRLTYEVNVDGETRTGSGVIQIVSEDTSKLPLFGRGFGFSATGEAVVVDLGDGRYLFSLLNGAGTLPFPPFYERYDFDLTRITAVDVTRVLAREKPSIELTADQLPMLVTFRNTDDPTSVREVDPDNLVATFGPGVRLESVTLEIADESLTEGKVEKTLSWLCDYKERRVRLSGQKGPISDNRLSNNLGTGAFKIGDCG
ncbi:hypothetical protein [Hoeflea sp. TYP-13]|uniref:hypothetical protein n=1 Tax=Hoeflea sp. TYP-13 TaxID=3230023 RepID=UPI0034C5B4E2